MREESSRVIANMERNAQAEKEQRARDFQAIQSNNAYTVNRLTENFNTQLQNMAAEAKAQSSAVQLKQAASNRDYQVTQSVIGLLKSFSSTAQQIYNDIQAEKTKTETEQNQAIRQKAEFETLIGQRQPTQDDVDQAQIRTDAEVAGDKISVASMTNDVAEGARRGTPKHEVAKEIVSNPINMGQTQRISNSVSMVTAFPMEMANRLGDVETKYTTPSGRTYTGVEARTNPELLMDLAGQTSLGLIKRYGFTDFKQLEEQDRRTLISSIDGFLKRAANESYELDREIGISQANTLLQGGKPNQLYKAGLIIKSFDGNAAMLDFYTKAIENPNTPQSTVDNIGELEFNGKKFKEGWRDNRWLPANQKRNQAIVKAEKDEFEYNKDVFTQNALRKMPEVTAFIDENPFLNGRIVSDQFTEKGFPVPAALKSHISNAIKGTTETTKSIIEQKFQDNIIDDNFVNSLPTVELRKYASDLKEEQDNRRFGPNYAGIKKSFIGDARLLTKINDGGSNTSQTYQVYAEVIKQYDRFIDEGFTPEEAAGQVNTLIQEVRSGGANSSNPFYYTDGDNNRRIFPNIESSGVERQERRNLVDKKLLTYGIDVLDKPYLVATEQEMDATYLSAQKGNTIYPPEVLRVSEKFKIKPSEAYNTIRKAQNLVTGENKPLLAPNPILQLVDQAEAKVRKLFQSGNRKMIERGGASMGLSALPLRRSMGGSSFNPDAVPAGYGGAISKAANANNIPPEILAGLLDTESNFNPKAVSPVGARGIAQFMPETAAEFGVNPADPMSSIDGAARYLRYLVDFFNGDMNLAIYAYNGGMGNIQRFGGPIPGNKENEEYLTKVLNNANKYR